MALDKDSMLSAEYGTLRAELLQRVSTRYTVINFALILFAGALGFRTPSLVLLYPIIACFLFGMYVSNERAKDRLTDYIKESIEKPVHEVEPSYEGWQSYYSRVKTDNFVPGWGRWIFVVTSVITLIVAVGIQNPDQPPPTVVLGLEYLAAIVAIVVTVILTFSARGLGPAGAEAPAKPRVLPQARDST